MQRRPRYDIDAQWDDPFEHREEHRGAERFSFALKVTIAAVDQSSGQRLVGPGLTQNLSLAGACLRTKHRLVPGQQVEVSFPTAMCPDTMYLPQSFVGPAQVKRVTELSGRLREVALRFDDSLAQNIEFGMFIDHLLAISSVMHAT